MALLSPIGTAYARDYFNPALLEIDNPALRGADLSVFEENSSQAPGNYRVDLYLNGEQIDSLDVEFRLMPGPAVNKRCNLVSVLRNWLNWA